MNLLIHGCRAGKTALMTALIAALVTTNAFAQYTPTVPPPSDPVTGTVKSYYEILKSTLLQGYNPRPMNKITHQAKVGTVTATYTYYVELPRELGNPMVCSADALAANILPPNPVKTYGWVIKTYNEALWDTETTISNQNRYPFGWTPVLTIYNTPNIKRGSFVVVVGTCAPGGNFFPATIDVYEPTGYIAHDDFRYGAVTPGLPP